MGTRKAISLSYELHVAVQALDGIGALARRCLDGTEEEARSAAIAVTSLLSVVSERLRLLERAVRGVVDPALLWHIANSALPGTDEEDVILVERERELDPLRASRASKTGAAPMAPPTGRRTRRAARGARPRDAKS